MPSGDRRSRLERLRALARERVDKTSLRNVAADIRIEYSALNRFLKGSKPRAITMARLEEWYEASADEVERLRQENEELRRKLEECEGKLGKR